MKTICVCGAGTMGRGIAQVSAAAGFSTLLYELNEEVLLNAKARLQKELQALVEKQKITEQKKRGYPAKSPLYFRYRRMPGRCGD